MSDNFRDIVKKHIGSSTNIEGIIRSLGIELDKKADLHPEISGQLERLPSGKFKISVNRRDHYYRRRFTMGHELGHYMLHANLIGNGVDDDKAYRSSPDGDFYNLSISAHEETEANRFAARILLPKSLILQKTFIGTSIVKLSKELQASPAATQIRLKTLGFTIGDDEVIGLPIDHPKYEETPIDSA